LQSDAYKGLLPEDLMDIIVQHRLYFNSALKTGSVFHLIDCLSEFSKLGMLSVGNSPEEAQAIYDRTIHILDMETQQG